MSNGIGSTALNLLQKVGRSFFLPIAILPIAGLLLGIGASFSNPTTIEYYGLTNIMGSGTLLYYLFLIMNAVGSAIFSNLPLIFAISISLGIANEEKAVAALSGAIAFITMHTTIHTILIFGGQIVDGQIAATVVEGSIGNVLGIQTLEMGVFGGIITGLITGALHNKFYKIQLPAFLSFFAGVRFVPIISVCAFLFVGIALYFVWPPVQIGILYLGSLVVKSGYIGTFFYGFIKRALIPFGLHHVFYMPFWQTAVGGTAIVDGVTIAGAQNIFFAQLASPNTPAFSVDATRFFTGEFIFMLAGLPGAALAMYHTAKSNKKKIVAGLLLSAALTSFLTGITEPIEFTFLFVAPFLYAIHSVLAGIAYMLAHILDITIGLTFSGGFIDLLLYGILPGNARTHWLRLLPLFAAYFLIYYYLFKFVILRFNLKTPGREDDTEESKLYTKDDFQKKQNTSTQSSDSDKTEQLDLLTRGLGGKDNIITIDCFITRLRVELKDNSIIDADLLKKGGGVGVVKIKDGKNVQVIIGTQVSSLKPRLQEYIARLK
ncbi:MAG: PTS transporter subunit EIIC [Elusimicrobiota bacterium]|nr:PTS transporter subunit EIIC [Elusimicrobiota bacterium]